MVANDDQKQYQLSVIINIHFIVIVSVYATGCGKCQLLETNI